jgi:hypothetical protein
MVSKPLLLSLGPIVASASLTPIPGGSLISSDCIFTVPNGETVGVDHEVISKMESCRSSKPTQLVGDAPYTWGTEQIYAQDVHLQNPDAQWLNFTADWVVPPLPEKHSGQVDYHWPGFKSQQPEMGYPVLQPVLQYGQTGMAKWQLQSWFVHGGATTAPAIDVQPGDEITSYMSFDVESETWTVYGENLSNNEKSVLTITKEALGGYDCTLHPTFHRPPRNNFADLQRSLASLRSRAVDWGMVVHETIMAKASYCSEYPASAGIDYTNVYLDGDAPEWTERVQKTDCEQQVKQGGGQVSFLWDATK